MAAAPRHNLITLFFFFLGIYQHSEQLDDAAVIRDPSFPELLTCEYLAVMDDHSASTRSPVSEDGTWRKLRLSRWRCGRCRLNERAERGFMLTGGDADEATRAANGRASPAFGAA
jgi:hypothetical protein